MDKQTARRRKGLKAEQAEKIDQGAEGALDVAADEEGHGSDEATERKMLEQEQRQAQLDALAGNLARKRRAAVDHRRGSGIEDIWREDEEFYEGIDAANRDETVTLKPRDMNGTGGASAIDSEGSATGSNIFLPITRPYVDFSAARAADMLLPTDDRNWDLRPTPMPDVIKALGSNEPLPQPMGEITTYGQAAMKMVQDAKEQVEKARTRIEDWHEEGQYHAEQRKVLNDAAKVGVAILKGPYPVKKMARAIVRNEQTGQIEMKTQKKIAPISKCISYWNFYPDPSCGEDIHAGSFVWEKDAITARQLRDLKGTMDGDEDDAKPMYIESAIDLCLKEGAQRKYEDNPQYFAPDTESFEIWYFHGVASAEDLAAAGVEVEEGAVVPVTITMVNDRVIKAARSTLDTSFPYDVMVWQPRENHWAGIGVARQVRAPQRMINAGVRNMMDNAGMGAGPMVVMMKGAISPMGKNQKMGIGPRRLFQFDPSESNIDDVRKAFATITIPMLTDELLSIIQFALKMAEDVTGLPMLMQGQQGQATDTVGGMQILTNNSNTPLRAIAKLYDDRVTEPHLLRYYEWLLLYGPEEDEKGDYIVAARGSSALFERDAQNQAILQMAPLVGNPAFKINPEKWLKESLKAQRLDPQNFQYSEDEWAQIQEQMAANPPPADPRLEAAKIAAQARVQTAEISAEVTKERIRVDTDRDTVYVQAERERAQMEGQLRMEEMALKRDLLILQLAETRNMSIQQIKADLASDAMKLKVQRELSLATANGKAASKETSAPPNEPAGRAETGESYQA